MVLIDNKQLLCEGVHLLVVVFFAENIFLQVLQTHN